MVNMNLSSENEHKILKFWEDSKVFAKLKAKNKGKKRFSFLDGPITANNPMGVHHGWGRTYKDLFQRYKAMAGFDLRWQNGFDCQGLWVEVEVEKELGFKNKKDIEKYGVEKFVNKCKERVNKYSAIQTEQSKRLGQFADWEHSYFTMSDENNYAIWYFLKQCKEKGLLYKGFDVVPWCSRCGTAISQHEILTEEYKEITHKAVFVKFAIVGQKNTYFLVWTTTPWTLPGNVALAVKNDFEYIKTKVNNETFILLKEKADEVLGKGSYEIIETIKGKDLEGIEYEGIFDELDSVQETLGSYKHKVILWDEVTQEEGTGIVHIAPGCGQEDYKLSRELGLPVINLTDTESSYLTGFGELSGQFAGGNKARQLVFDNLQNKSLVFKIEDYTHRYPTCWRCKSELIFRLVNEWFISMQKLREPLKESAKKINWLPGFCLEREIDWLNNMQDWLISKKRYWGLALPIWQCECGNFEVIGSKKELQEKAVEGWESFEGKSPHKPQIDKIKIKCAKCGKIANRVEDVGTPWLDAGIVPFSTVSDDNRANNIPYFSGNKEEWQKWFPVDFVCESFPGQFKNWFYVLLVMSQVLEGIPPFKTLLGYASVVDENGEEMHKSKGNAIWFDEGVEKISADVMRWMYVTQNPKNNMRFGFNVARETQRKLLTLTNCYTFYQTYKTNETNESAATLLDEWVISRLNSTIKTATQSLDKFDPAKASNEIENFWINELSLWYIRRTRKNFAQAQATLFVILKELSKLIAPFMPFLAEQMYQELKGKDDAVSVSLCDWPAFDEKLINAQLESEMQTTRHITSLGLAKRAQANIGVRQALNKLKVKNKASINEELLALIEQEVNVKEIAFDETIEDEVELDTEITQSLKQEGILREIIRHIQSLRKKANLTPSDNKIIICFLTESKEIEKVIKNNEKEIKETTRCCEINKLNSQEGEFLQSKEVAAIVRCNEKEILTTTRCSAINKLSSQENKLFLALKQ